MDTTFINIVKDTRHKMIILDKIKDLTSQAEILKLEKKKIGFVPTMGALHDGHLALVKRAREENDVVVVSIFVNPTQFNNADDLKNYPRTPEEDHRKLNDNNVDIIFSPAVEEIYNSKNASQNILQLGKIADVMEGAHRPGHFAGVVQIVSRLFDLVKPQRAYFGEKDFQQLAIIRFMVSKLNYPVEIIACPTVREKSGLAMSSRNLKLSEKSLDEAAMISKALFFAKENREKFSPLLLKQKAADMIESSGKLKVEYVEIADEETLQQVIDWNQHKHVRIFAAVFCDGVRLIDNVRM